jgi:hypothetical protein
MKSQAVPMRETVTRQSQWRQNVCTMLPRATFHCSDLLGLYQFTVLILPLRNALGDVGGGQKLRGHFARFGCGDIQFANRYTSVGISQI